MSRIKARLAKLENNRQGGGCSRCRPNYAHFADEGSVPEACEMCGADLIEVMLVIEEVVDASGQFIEDYQP